MKAIILSLAMIGTLVQACVSADAKDGEVREQLIVNATVKVPTYVNYAWLENTSVDSLNTLAYRCEVPSGFQRIVADSGSFGEWLRYIPLYPEGKRVLLYNGNEKRRQDVHAAVINIDPGKSDLQQCADATMRLRA